MRVTMSYLTFSLITGDNAIGSDMACRLSEDFIYSDTGRGERYEGGSLSRGIRAIIGWLKSYGKSSTPHDLGHGSDLKR